MNIIKTLNHFWHKPEAKPIEAKKKESIDLSMLENHFIFAGVNHCDTCKHETANCCKIDFAGRSVCICPRKDIKGFRKA